MSKRSFLDWLDYQNQVHSLAMDFSLERILAVCQTLGVLKPRAKVITVGGTNGKGSVTAMIESMARASGLTTGLYTSPHLLDYSERIKLNGQGVSHDHLIEHFERVESQRNEHTLTFFEFATATALSVFQQADVDLMILEVGLGGRLDAVNIIDPDVSVVVSISLDHQELLGHTVEQIGQEKAGIFRAHRPCVFGAVDRPQSIDAAADALGAKLYAFGRDFNVWPLNQKQALSEQSAERDAQELSGSAIELAHRRVSDIASVGLAGEHQWINAATALMALTLAYPQLPDESLKRGLAATRLRGRFEIHVGQPTFVFDVAHNEGSVRTLAQQVKRVRQHRKIWWIGGLLIEKDAPLVAQCLRLALAENDNVIAVGLSGERARSAYDLQSQWEAPLGRTVRPIESVQEALETVSAQASADDWVVVFGSFHVVAPALAWYEQRFGINSCG